MTATITNQIHTYLTPIVTHLTGWFAEHKYIKYNPEKIEEFYATWENEQLLQLEKMLFQYDTKSKIRVAFSSEIGSVM